MQQLPLLSLACAGPPALSRVPAGSGRLGALVRWMPCRCYACAAGAASARLRAWAVHPRRRAYTTAILDHWGSAGEGLPDHVAFMHAHQWSTHTHLSHDWVIRALATHRPHGVPLGYADAQCGEQVRWGLGALAGWRRWCRRHAQGYIAAHKAAGQPPTRACSCPFSRLSITMTCRT